MMNKNSLLKSSILSKTDEFEEFDIINMVSNVDLYNLEQVILLYFIIKLNKELWHLQKS